MRALTGGYKLRVLLAQALFGKPQGLLLDEPTNHLDIDSIRWLEKFLRAYEGVLITISHDRHFLNAICTHIADIDYETIITYPGGYDDMVRHKGQVRSRVESENAEKKKKISQLQDFVARFHAGTRASQVQSRIRSMQKLKLEDMKRSNIQAPFIKFELKAPSGKQTLTLEGIDKRYGGNEVIQPFSALVTRGEKICVIGKNGVGKTTLVKMIAGELQPDRGHVKWGHQAQVGYLPQDQQGVIRPGTTAFGWLRELEDKLSNEEISGLLGRMLFSGEERMKPTATLSGGETVRLLLAKLMLYKDNVLVLDEPTNHLDLQSIAALSEGLQRYEGTDHRRHARPGAHPRGGHAHLGPAPRRAGARLPGHVRRVRREAPGPRRLRMPEPRGARLRPSSRAPPAHRPSTRASTSGRSVTSPSTPSARSARISSSSSTVQTWTGMPSRWKWSTHRRGPRPSGRPSARAGRRGRTRRGSPTGAAPDFAASTWQRRGVLREVTRQTPGRSAPSRSACASKKDPTQTRSLRPRVPDHLARARRRARGPRSSRRR